jgi:hypothetical protein
MNPETRALLRNHLMYNAYPPPRNMDGVMEACEKAIDHINSGDYNEKGNRMKLNDVLTKIDETVKDEVLRKSQIIRGELFLNLDNIGKDFTLDKIYLLIGMVSYRMKLIEDVNELLVYSVGRGFLWVDELQSFHKKSQQQLDILNRIVASLIEKKCKTIISQVTDIVIDIANIKGDGEKEVEAYDSVTDWYNSNSATLHGLTVDLIAQKYLKEV